MTCNHLPEIVGKPCEDSDTHDCYNDCHKHFTKEAPPPYDGKP
jgi:hypothetical protein